MKPSRGQPPRAPINDAAAAPTAGTTPLWRRALAVICVLGVPVANTGSIEFGRYMEARLPGGGGSTVIRGAEPMLIERTSNATGGRPPPSRTEPPVLPPATTELVVVHGHLVEPARAAGPAVLPGTFTK